eukprot:SAG22_NODE_1768_length_3615_cov_6.235495_3_plen_172_part_00
MRASCALRRGGGGGGARAARAARMDSLINTFAADYGYLGKVGETQRRIQGNMDRIRERNLNKHAEAAAAEAAAAEQLAAAAQAREAKAVRLAAELQAQAERKEQYDKWARQQSGADLRLGGETAPQYIAVQPAAAAAGGWRAVTAAAGPARSCRAASGPTCRTRGGCCGGH